MAKKVLFSSLGILSIAILLLVSCAPIATSIGMTPTLAPTDTPAPVVTAEGATETPVPEVVVGVVVVEVVFVYPGIGQLMVDAVSSRDMPVVQACALIFAATYILLNLLADIV